MSDLIAFPLREEYKRLESLGDKCSKIELIIDWESFHLIINEMYDNKTELGGRPNNDAIAMCETKN